ncbi:response regulator [Cohnella thermotolerans]|uniref:response regulator n=1 Tax=Cohnella thermotolerans TaxID=329858 RepID=UPI0003F7750B|nr:response regulator [Cohnella thermotolerans]
MLHSLRLRTWLLLLLTTGLTLLICGWIYYESAGTTIRNSLLDNAGTSARTGSESLEARIDTLLKQASALSDRISANAGSEEAYMTALKREFWPLASFTSLGYSNLKGRLVLTDGTVADIKTSPAFAKAAAGVTAVTQSYNAPIGHVAPGVHLLVPIRDRYRMVAGVLWATASIQTIVDGLAPFDSDDKVRERQLGDYVLLDSEGNVIYATKDTARIDYGVRRSLVRSLDKEDGTIVDDGADKLFASNVKGTGWSLVFVVPTGKLFEPLRRLLARTIAISLAAELALAVLLLALISPPFKRIRKILRTTEAVAAGQFRVRPLAPGWNDEIGALASSVNGMVEQLRNLFEPLQAVTKQNDYGIIVTDENYVITQFNETAQRMLGYSAEEVVKKRTPVYFSSMEELEAKARKLSVKRGYAIRPGIEYFRANLDRRMSYSEERTYVRKDGSSFPVFLNVSKIVDHLGRVSGYVGLFRDISGQKQIQAELIRSKQAAEDANTAKSAFLARMSHEIRTPINGIVGLAQLLARTELTEAQQDYLQKIVTSSEVLLGIVNDILDFSKIEAGKFKLDKSAFEPEELFRKLGDTLSIFLSKKQLEMIFDVPGTLPQRLVGDPLRLEQVLLNLANNAIKFTNRGYVLFQVQMTEAGTDKVTLEFAIEDTGIGISEEQMARLFQPFSQADGSTSRKYGGTGLGLVIAAELVAMMGGKLEADSVPGVGSRFSFSLTFPVAKGDPAAEPPVPPAEDARMRILCIERPGLMQQALQGMLASLNAETTFADSWRAALSLLNGLGDDHRFDYVICNMEMPDMYGTETWLELLEAAGTARTIAMTTPFGQSEWLRLEEAERPYRTLIKPVNRKSLRNLFESMQQERTHERPAASSGTRKRRKSDKPRILLAEDHTINQQIACELLQSKGYETGIASDGREALERLREEHWDLVLMDLHMPEMDGFEAARRIRADRNGWQLPIVAMTANVLLEDRQKCFNAGMNDVVTKPIQADTLFAVVERWVRHARQIDWEDALERVNGKEMIIRHMLRTFGQQYAGFDGRLRSRLAEGDAEGARKLLHALKGVAGNLSARPVFEAAAALETALADDEGAHAGAAAWKELFERLERALRELLEAIYFEENRQNNSLYIP